MTGSNRTRGRTSRRPEPLAPAVVEQRLGAAGAHYAAGRLDEASAAYEAVEARNPDDVRAPYSLAVIDIRQGRFPRARERLQRVVRREPGLFRAQHNLGYVSQTLGLWREAAKAYEAALALRPDAADTEFNLAAALAVLGRTDEAIERYRALTADSALGLRALTAMALLNASAVSDAELAILRRASADPGVDPDVRTGLLFALGEVLEARRSDEAAFAAFAAGNQLKYERLVAASNGPAGPAAHPKAVARDHARSIERLKTMFTPAFIAAHRGAGNGASRPIFIVGMPRSGSSLIEQILSSHPAVQGLGESPALAETLQHRRAYDPAQPRDGAYFRDLADAYLAELRARGWDAGARPVDKTLESFLHVGMIALMFPRAVVLHSVRDPVDTCLACYRQLFAAGNETLYDLGQIGAEYVGYRAVMDHWRAVLPGRVVEVGHEALVKDPERQIRWLVTEACGLGWDPACLDFHRTERSVRTASVAQVRQPIVTSSLQRWRRYERHLGPLFEALGPYSSDLSQREREGPAPEAAGG
jgi:Flp pilus assembly protein TadD